MEVGYSYQTKSNYVFKLPFGEEIQSDTGGRSTAQGYGGQDSIRQKFTTYERDAETDLDFAQARMYQSKLGRFTVIDPIIMESLRLADPQRINLYLYVRNNPLNFTDPLGEKIKVKGSKEDIQRYEDDLNNRLKDTGLQITVNKEGVVEVKGKTPNNLAGAAKLLLAAIGHDKTATISLVKNDGQVDFGTPYGNDGKVASEQRIDTADLDVLNKAKIEGYDSSNIIYHETVEAIEIQIYGNDPDKAHGQANSVAPGLVITGGFSVPSSDKNSITHQITNYRVAFSNTEFKILSAFGKQPTITEYDANKGKSKEDKFKFRATYPLNIVEIQSGAFKQK
jgi:RHS repeat-associated protein